MNRHDIVHFITDCKTFNNIEIALDLCPRALSEIQSVLSLKPLMLAVLQDWFHIS